MLIAKLQYMHNEMQYYMYDVIYLHNTKYIRSNFAAQKINDTYINWKKFNGIIKCIRSDRAFSLSLSLSLGLPPLIIRLTHRGRFHQTVSANQTPIYRRARSLRPHIELYVIPDEYTHSNSSSSVRLSRRWRLAHRITPPAGF